MLPHLLQKVRCCLVSKKETEMLSQLTVAIASIKKVPSHSPPLMMNYPNIIFPPLPPPNLHAKIYKNTVPHALAVMVMFVCITPRSPMPEMPEDISSYHNG
jgi:hypothetical protein